MRSVFSPSVHRIIFLGSLVLALISLPFSKFTLTISIMVFLANWLVEGEWNRKWTMLKTNYSVFFFSAIFVSLVIGLLYSTNIVYGQKEVIQKLPLLVFPIVFASSKPVSQKEKCLLIGSFVTAVFVYTLISCFLFIYNFNTIGDVRDISPFVSHIRFSLMVNISIAAVVWALSSIKKLRTGHRFLGFTLILWFVLYLFVLKSLTGIVLLFVLASLFLIYKTLKFTKPLHRVLLFVAVLLLWTIPAIYLTTEANRFFQNRQVVDDVILNDTTVNGNHYRHNLKYLQYENGNLVWINVCRRELKKEWNLRSEIDYTGKDKLGQPLSSTLIRYLASLGLSKDSVGVWSLTEEDIMHIESGATNILFKQNRLGLYPRLYQTFWEIDQYRMYNHVSGSSLVQRYVFIRAGFNILLQNFWIGVGTGDLVDEFNSYYHQNEPKLKRKYWYLSHNQFLTHAVQVGLIGFLLFIAGWFVPLYIKRKSIDLLSVAFFIIATLSMLNEDTFQTHVGVTLTATFYGMLIFGTSSNDAHE